MMGKQEPTQQGIIPQVTLWMQLDFWMVMKTMTGFVGCLQDVQ